ncbi:MAG: GNAT family N-acetyltransferase [Janthinobacterium lividum]
MLTRPFTDEDYAEISRISNAAFPDYPSSPVEIKFRDTHRDPKCLQARWIAEDNGMAVGFGEYGQRANAYHPRRFHLDVTVQPSHQGQGFGKALYDQILQALSEFNPLSVRTMTREDMPRPLRFLKERGFTEDMRTFESRLAVAAFDPAPYVDADARVTSQGITFKTLRELEHLPGHTQKHFELSQELNADVPSPDPHTPMEKDVWRRRFMENPNLLPDAYLFAVHGDAYVGVTMLFSSQGNTNLYTGLTAVKREYRRKGIALALKLRAIAWAKAQGHPLIKTWNESNNRGMLGINEQLGFVRQPAWLDMVKTLAVE